MRTHRKLGQITCKVPLEFVTETDVKAAHDEKCHHNAHENQVTHKTSPATELTTRVRSYRYDDSVTDEQIIKMSAFRVKISLSQLWSLNPLPRLHGGHRTDCARIMCS